MLRACVIFLIGLYQRYLSPCKGFRCAHAAWHGGPSCSITNDVKGIYVVANLVYRGTKAKT
jgi:putative component of membrane protein insertase Oxa1/YidC/SpoIIIJ protein YidD